MKTRPAVFLDRDGTLNVDVHYLSAPSKLELLPGASRALRRLAQAGFVIVVVTNQSGVARGKLDEATLASIHVELAAQLAEQGAGFDAVYYCPHHPSEGQPPYRAACDCRKPLPGLLTRAARELSLDLSRSWVIGDSLRDLEAGAALGVPGILVGTGKGQTERQHLARVGPPAAQYAENVCEAAEAILAATPDAQGR